LTVVTIAPMPFTHTETVRFRDVDSMGHMNNAVYATFLEQARIAFLRPRGADQSTMILARLEIDFRRPVATGDTVAIDVRPGGVGTKSFELEYTMRVDQDVVAEARSVLVAYDYAAASSVEVPNALREALAA
jgi:acyl-CoA thioester hydrolase